jgi:hypothetical protein
MVDGRPRPLKRSRANAARAGSGVTTADVAQPHAPLADKGEGEHDGTTYARDARCELSSSLGAGEFAQRRQAQEERRQEPQGRGCRRRLFEPSQALVDRRRNAADQQRHAGDKK